METASQSTPLSQIRFANLADIALLHKIHQSAFKKAWSEKTILNSLQGNRCHGIIIDAVGFILFEVNLDECEILTIAVDKAAQKNGIGKQLLAEMLGVCQHMQIKKVFLEVSEVNFAAIALYKKFTFIEYNRRKKYYSDKSDALLLRLEL